MVRTAAALALATAAILLGGCSSSGTSGAGGGAGGCVEMASFGGQSAGGIYFANGISVAIEDRGATPNVEVLRATTVHSRGGVVPGSGDLKTRPAPSICAYCVEYQEGCTKAG